MDVPGERTLDMGDGPPPKENPVRCVMGCIRDHESPFQLIRSLSGVIAYIERNFGVPVELELSRHMFRMLLYSCPVQQSFPNYFLLWGMKIVSRGYEIPSEQDAAAEDAGAEIFYVRWVDRKKHADTCSKIALNSMNTSPIGYNNTGYNPVLPSNPTGYLNTINLTGHGSTGAGGVIGTGWPSEAVSISSVSGTPLPPNGPGSANWPLYDPAIGHLHTNGYNQFINPDGSIIPAGPVHSNGPWPPVGPVGSPGLAGPIGQSGTLGPVQPFPGSSPIAVVGNHSFTSIGGSPTTQLQADGSMWAWGSMPE